MADDDVQPDGTAEPAAPPPPKLVDELFMAATFFALGVTVAVALVESGTSATVILVASIVVYSATSTLAFLAVDDAGGSTLAGVISGWLVASRFGILAVSLKGRLRVSRTEQVVAALQALDPNVGLMMQQPDPAVARRTYWRITAVLVGGWVGGTIAGLVAGEFLGDTRRIGFDVVFPAALLAIIAPLLRRRDGLASAIGGVALCLALFPVAPAGVPIVASALAAVAVALSGGRTGLTPTPGGAR